MDVCGGLLSLRLPPRVASATAVWRAGEAEQKPLSSLHRGPQGLLASAATIGAQALRTLCFPCVRPLCQGQRGLWSAPGGRCKGLSSCSRLLSFVSCLQMQQKVKVTTGFDFTGFPPLLWPQPFIARPSLPTCCSIHRATLRPSRPAPSPTLTHLAATTTIFSFF